MLQTVLNKAKQIPVQIQELVSKALLANQIMFSVVCPLWIPAIVVLLIYCC